MIFICKIVGDHEAAFKQYSEIIAFLLRMLDLKDDRIKKLEESGNANRKRGNDFQKENRDLKEQLNSVQQERDRFLQELSTLQQDHAQRLAELEDERKDKQMYQQRFEHIFNCVHSSASQSAQQRY